MFLQLFNMRKKERARESGKERNIKATLMEVSKSKMVNWSLNLTAMNNKIL